MSFEPGSKALEEQLLFAVRRFALSSSSASREVADMSALSRITSVLPLSNLAYWERLIRREFELARRDARGSGSRGWWASVPFLGSKAQNESVRFLTWLDLNSWDGHVRERTLRALAGPAPNGFFFALALRRLNDWVPEVRAAAREAVPKLAHASDPEHVTDALCAMLPTWTYWGRVGELDKLSFMALVSVPGVAVSIKRRVITSSAGPMSSILSQALRSALLDEYLEQIAAEAIQPSVRARAYRALLTGTAVWVEGRRWQWTDVRYCQGRLTHILGERSLQTAIPFIEIMHAAASDPSSVVRRVAAEALIREMNSLGDSVLFLARRFAQDVSPAVAERGAFALQQLADTR